MKRVLFSLFLTSVLFGNAHAELTTKPLSVKIRSGSTLKQESAQAPSPVYELKAVSTPTQVIPDEETVVIKTTQKPVIEVPEVPVVPTIPTPQIKKPEPTPIAAKKTNTDTAPPVIYNLPNTVRYIGTGEFEVSFDVNEPSFVENSYSGALAWFNDTPMTRVSGTLTDAGEHYVFRTTVSDQTPDGPAALKIRTQDAAGNQTEITNTMYVVHKNISKKPLSFVGKGTIETSFSVNKTISKRKSASISAFLNTDHMTLLNTVPYGDGEKYTFRTTVTDSTAEGLATTRLRVKDAAGNISEIETKKIIIDTTAPVISGLPSTTDYRQEGPFLVEFSVSEPVSTGLGKSKIEAWFNGNALTLVSMTYNNGKENYTYRGDIQSNTKEGTANIVVRAEDAAGNISIINSDAIVVDLTAPDIANLNVNKRFLSSEKFNLEFDVSEFLLTGVGLSKVRVLFNGLPMSQVSATYLKSGGVRYKYQTEISKNEKQGLAAIQISLTDKAGHSVTKSMDDTAQVIVDTIPPIIDIQPECDYLPAGDFLLNLNISEAISGQDGEKSVSAFFNNKQIKVAHTIPEKNGEISQLRIKVSPSEQQGPGVLEIKVTDQSGNTAFITSNKFIVDTIPPIIYGTPTEKRRVTSGLLEIGVGINEKLTPGVGKTSISAEFNGEQMKPIATKSDEFGNWNSFTFPITKSTQQGEARIVIQVSDASGNKVSSIYPGIIVDSQPAILNELEILPEIAAPVTKPTTKKRRRK